jgi:predicted RNA binding protein YcfA (HicA-like mRNA interferase family)
MKAYGRDIYRALKQAITTMSKREKLRLKLRNNPKGRTKQDIFTLLGHFGFILDHVTGSHHVFRCEINGTIYRIVVPIHGQKIKPLYVKEIIQTIDALFAVENTKDELPDGDDTQEDTHD